MSNSLEVLAEEKNHAALMLAEVAGWLHDMGKCDDRLLLRSAIDYDVAANPITYNYKRTHSSRVQSHTLDLPGETPISLKTLVEDGMPGSVYTPNAPWLVRTLGFCHAAAHTEKEEIGYLLKQTMADTRLSSSFGYESLPLTGMNTRLASLPIEQLSPRSTFFSDVETAFGNTTAETRRPINDVTLWDWSNIVAAMYKAALAAALLGYKEEPPNMHWRLLSVRLNGVAFSERAVRIPDLLARQELITDGLNNVRTLLEEKYPLGTEVYRDENGSVFIVPNIDSLLDLEDGKHRKLRLLIIDKFSAGTVRDDPSLALNGEVIPSLECDTVAWTRKMPRVTPLYEHQEPLPIAEHVKAEKVPPLKADVHMVRNWWESQKESTCSVCQLRPQGWNEVGIIDQKALERKVCSICERRREDRSKRWITNDKLKKTIWIDEIADASGTLALVVGKFDLTHWLDGRMLFFPGVEQELFVDSLQSNVLVHGIRGRVGGHYRILLDKSIQNIAQVTVGDNWLIDEQNFQVKREERDDLNCLPVETVDSEAIHLVETQLLHPDRSKNEQHFKPLLGVEIHTPARLQRVWEIAQQFWKNCEGQLSDKDIVDKISLRLRIKGSVQGGNRDTLGPYHTYEIKLGNLRMSVVYVEMDNDFLIIDNLRRIAALLDAPEEYQKDERTAAAFIKDRLQREKSLPLETPAGYGSVNKPLGSFRIGTVEEEYMAYSPALTILSEPGTFMALVPADKALKVVDAIKERYEGEMGKVRNRLPLTVGVIFAGSRTPLPTILDAGRRVLRQQTQDEEWEVKVIDKTIIEPPNPGPWPSKVKLVLERRQQSISMTVPTVMGDGKTRDEWYPYWRMAFPVANEWVHVYDLRARDKIYLMPSRFDFEFLDTASRRFEVSYENGKRRGLVHPARPYYLEQLAELEELWEMLSDGPGRLATSQIHNLVGLIEAKRSEWYAKQDDPVFKQIVKDIIANVWKDCPDLHRFVQAAVSGQLTDVVELHMSILKETQKGDNE